ncbi:hypothetical protein DVH24_013417 [Malus domestica]|uniref:F-box domain-containing protein n=1 Tax=Malus domestica TaxID=3750 RepID=A0A498HNE0_MALDO|nr:hypothetical protein DVH24_013417 [Malus domestica]
MMKKGRTTSSSTQSVFDDVLLKILIIIASRSLNDLFSVNMVSKKFKEIADDPRIYQHINIINFETVNPLRSCCTLKLHQSLHLVLQPRGPLHGGDCNLGGPSSSNVSVRCNLCVPQVRFQARKAQTSIFSQLSQPRTIECNGMLREVSAMFVGEVKAQILNLYHDKAVIKPCNDCGSPQGPITFRTHWDAYDHEKLTTCNACRWQHENDEERQKGTTTLTFIQSLSNKFLMEILTTKVTSGFLRSLYSTKMVCKKFNQLAEHDHILEHISIQRFERVDSLTSQRRHEKVYKFLEQCRECNNPEALCTRRIRRSPRVIKHIHIWCNIGVPQGVKKREASTFSEMVSVMECRERARWFFWSIRVDREVRSRIIKLHEDNVAAKACNDCGSAQGPFTI